MGLVVRHQGIWYATMALPRTISTEMRKLRYRVAEPKASLTRTPPVVSDTGTSWYVHPRLPPQYVKALRAYYNFIRQPPLNNPHHYLTKTQSHEHATTHCSPPPPSLLPGDRTTTLQTTCPIVDYSYPKGRPALTQTSPLIVQTISNRQTIQTDVLVRVCRRRTRACALTEREHPCLLRLQLDRRPAGHRSGWKRAPTGTTESSHATMASTQEELT